MTVTANTFRREGWELLNHGNGVPERLTEEHFETWSRHFGCDPAICLELWVRIQGLGALPDGARPKHLLWSLYFLRCYDEEHKEKVFLRAARNTIRSYVHPIVKCISDLAVDIIDFDRRFEGNTPVQGHNVYVDCSAFQATEERKPFSKAWSSVKHGKKAGLNYEVCTSLATGFIVWTNGPFPAGEWPDKKIFDRDLILHIKQGEKVLADSGYTGRDTYITVTGRQENDPILKRIKARHEQVNGWMKKWNCLSKVFRHDKQMHYQCFHAVAVITQIEMETGYKAVFPLVGT